MIRHIVAEPSPRVSSESLNSRFPPINKKVTDKVVGTPSNKILLSPKQILLSPKKLMLSPKQQLLLSPSTSAIKRMELGRNVFDKYLKPPTSSFAGCNCCHVIAADDDSFQRMYYTNIFKKSINCEELGLKTTEFKLEVCSSGEDLVERVSVMLKCGCKKLLAIITDYSMGEKRLTGYKTAEKLRQAGWQKPILLRTSESKSELAQLHPDLDKIIDCIIEKGNKGPGCKDIVMKYLKESKGVSQ